jgi:uncharacterized protein (TIGR03118 family)
MQFARTCTNWMLTAAAALTLSALSSTALAQRYQQINLVSDLPNIATFQNPHLKNAWGIAFPPGGPFWIADNGTGLSTLYAGDGTILPLVVTIPPPMGAMGPSAPTGLVFNGSGDFVVRESGKMGSSLFMFDSEDGTISGWNPGVDLTKAVLVVDNSQSGAVYKGLALAQTRSGKRLYATNFHSGMVEIYDSRFHWAGSFTDTSVPPRYAPFGIQNIGGMLFVTFAEQNADKHDDVAGPGHGFVDVFDTDGNLVRRFASRGKLNSPWGVAVAPPSFGRFANDILIGNFGDGRISAFDPMTGAFRGQLLDQNGVILSINGLWSITPGGGLGSTPNDFFFTAGLNDEADGLFGKLTPVP